MVGEDLVNQGGEGESLPVGLGLVANLPLESAISVNSRVEPRPSASTHPAGDDEAR